MRRNALNLRDLGGIPLQDGKGKTPHDLYLRSGKLSALTHETGSDPMTIIRSLRKQPEKLKKMILGVAMAIQENGTDSLDYFAMLRGWGLR